MTARRDGVRRFLVTGPPEQLWRFHLRVAARLHAIERRRDTVFYTCLEEDAIFALGAARQADVSVQEVVLVDGAEVYPTLQAGSHGLQWTRRES